MPAEGRILYLSDIDNLLQREMLTGEEQAILDTQLTSEESVTTWNNVTATTTSLISLNSRNRIYNILIYSTIISPHFA